MTKRRAVSMLKVDPPPMKEIEWNRWYNNKHIPERLATPGFLYTRRFTKIEGVPKGFAITGEPKYLTLYELANADVLRSEQFLKLKEQDNSQPPDSFEAGGESLPNLARGVYEQIYPEQGEYKPPPTKFILIIGHEVPRNKQKEFNTWYNTERIPTMLRIPGIATYRRFVLAKGEFLLPVSRGGAIPGYLTIYDIENESIFESEAFLNLRVDPSPWSVWVQSWCTLKMCALYYRIYPEE